MGFISFVVEFRVKGIDLIYDDLTLSFANLAQFSPRKSQKCSSATLLVASAELLDAPNATDSWTPYSFQKYCPNQNYWEVECSIQIHSSRDFKRKIMTEQSCQKQFQTIGRV